jgi:hypothetical protein
MGISYVEDIPVQDYIRLHEAVGWGTVPEAQAVNTVANAAYVISARKDDTVIGISRLLWDGARPHMFATSSSLRTIRDWASDASWSPM